MYNPIKRWLEKRKAKKRAELEEIRRRWKEQAEREKNCKHLIEIDGEYDGFTAQYGKCKYCNRVFSRMQILGYED